jgi:hypothetical protein
MTLSRKDQDAVEVVKTAILALFEPKTIDHIDVLPAENQTGEPALSVTVFLSAPQERMSGTQLLDAIAAAATALREIEDYRFPYVTFLAPEDESAEDTRPAA